MLHSAPYAEVAFDNEVHGMCKAVIRDCEPMVSGALIVQLDMTRTEWSSYPICYDWLSSKIREAYEDEQGRRRALVQRERSKARQSGWRQDVLSE